MNSPSVPSRSPVTESFSFRSSLSFGNVSHSHQHCFESCCLHHAVGWLLLEGAFKQNWNYLGGVSLDGWRSGPSLTLWSPALFKAIVWRKTCLKCWGAVPRVQGWSEEGGWRSGRRGGDRAVPRAGLAPGSVSECKSEMGRGSKITCE